MSYHKKIRVLLIASGQPSSNPRLIKEADALANAGYSVKVLYTYWNAWAITFDDHLIKQKKWEAIRIGGTPKDKRFAYFLSKLIHKLATIGAKKFNLAYFAEYAISRNSYILMKKAIECKADIYIAHNLGALPAAARTAGLHHKPYGFDAEDYHRNETSNDPYNFEVVLKTYIEHKYIPNLAYLTTSSPQINEAYRSLFPDKDPVTILNVFNKVPGVNIRMNQHLPLRLFWFSQTIGTNRGIENAIKALNGLKAGKFELHLLGNLQLNVDKEYFENLVNDKIFSLNFYDPIAPDDLITFSSQFDIGLALEPAFSINNDMALSNKIFTYMQGGLAIVASNTIAQGEFLKKHPEIGKVYEINDALSLSDVLLYYLQNRDQLFKAKQASLQLAQTSLNWENEQVKFLKVVQQALVS